MGTAAWSRLKLNLVWKKLDFGATSSISLFLFSVFLFLTQTSNLLRFGPKQQQLVTSCSRGWAGFRVFTSSCSHKPKLRLERNLLEQGGRLQEAADVAADVVLKEVWEKRRGEFAAENV